MNKSKFIVGNKYIITNCDNDYPYRQVGLVLTAKRDDGTDIPVFTLPAGMTDDFGDDWAFFDVENVEPCAIVREVQVINKPTLTQTVSTTESIQPFVVTGMGKHWYIMKPSGEYVNIYFNTTKAAFAVAETLAEVYHA